MILKIGNVFYNSDLRPIMVILTKKDKENIANMLEDNFKYCQYPDIPEYTDNDFEKIKEWMKAPYEQLYSE